MILPQKCEKYVFRPSYDHICSSENASAPMEVSEIFISDPNTSKLIQCAAPRGSTRFAKDFRAAHETQEDGENADNRFAKDFRALQETNGDDILSKSIDRRDYHLPNGESQ